jgi:hypothetical protein
MTKTSAKKWAQPLTLMLKKLVACLFIMICSFAVRAQHADIDQAGNGQYTTPDNPVVWQNGNLNSNQAHYIERHSIPYRLRMTGLIPGQEVTLILGYDAVKKSGAKFNYAIDFISGYHNLQPHNYINHSTAESVYPMNSFQVPTNTMLINPPGYLNSGVEGASAALADFNALPDSSKRMSLWGASFVTGWADNTANGGTTGENIGYSFAPDVLILSGSDKSVQFTIKFIPTSTTATLGWGGHIATRLDWGYFPNGDPRSAGGISGSPYHMRTIDWNLSNLGNQDRSLQIALAAPTCPGNLCRDALGNQVPCPSSVCPNTQVNFGVPTSSGATIYSWTVTGDATASGAGDLPTFTVLTAQHCGSFTVTVQLQNGSGFITTCSTTILIVDTEKPKIFLNGVDQGIDGSIVQTFECGGTVPGLSALTYSDNCNPNIVPTNSNPIPVIIAGTGDTTINGVHVCYVQRAVTTWVVTDYCGNTNTFRRIVYFIDTHPPVITGFVNSDLVQCNGEPDWGTPAVNDNCFNSAALTVGFHDYSISMPNCVTKYIRRWGATDGCGNMADSVDQYFLIRNDHTGPTTATPHADFRANCNTPFASLVFAPVVFADGCSGVASTVVTTTHTTGAGCDSLFTRKWVATDSCGNKDSVSQVITVKYDVTKPTTASAHADFRANCNTPFAQLTWASVSWTDNCDGALGSGVVTTTHATGVGCDSVFTRKWVATDGCGNKDSVSQAITVKYDITKPTTTTAHADFRADCNTPFAQLVWADVQWNDNCDGALGSGVVTTTHATGAGCDSTFTRKWVATDGCGNKDSVSQIVTVKYDITKPTTQTAHVDLRADCNTPFAQLVWANVQWTDNCDGALGSGVVTTTHATGAGCDSTFTRKWVATDACGNKDSVSQVITVKYDITKPTTTTAHADLRADCNTPFAQLVWANVQWTDNCDGALGSGVVTTIHSQGDGCDSTFTRKWVATDACGNKDSVTQTITVKYDNTKPATVTPHADFRANCNTPFAQLVWANVQWNDNCDGALGSGVVTTTHATGAGCDSTFTRKWVATDACGNKDSVSQVITVKYDITKPTTTSAHNDLRADCNTPFAQLVWANVQWNDNCDGALGSGVVTTTHATGAGCDSTFTRKWVATDACGNKDSVSQVITVKYDITKPTTATAHPDSRADCNTPFAQLVWANVQWTDNCDGALGSGVVTTTHATGAGCDSTFTRKWVAIDACGNKDSVSQVITVKYDITKPTTATAHPDLRADCNTPFAQLVWANVQWTDNCDGALGSGVVTTTHATGAGCDSTFTRKWVATDACGNKDSVSQVITVKYDITKPTTQTAHADLRADCNTPFAQLVWANVQWTDNCDGALGSGVVTTTHATGAGCDSVFTRKWVATDACGNKDSVTQVITVKYDITKPTTTSAHNDLRADCNTPFAQLVWANVQWNDNCDGALGSGVVTTTHATGAGCDSTFTRKWVATDACGNKDSVSQVITVKYDVTKPTTASAHADLRADCNTPFAQLVWANVQWTDNCDGALGSGVVTTTHATGAGCDSTFTRKWVATDACGNKDSVSQVITVKYDITKPTTATAHPDSRADCNTPFGQLVWANVQWNDNCDGALGSGVVTTTHATGAGCDSTFTRKWVATDACGNKDSVSQVITVKYDITKPTTTSAHADFRADCNTPFAQLVWANVQWNDNCDGALGSGVVTTTHATGAGCDSTFTRKWVATDACGNKDSVSQVITVKYDITKPTTQTAHADLRADCNTPFAQLVWANVQWTDNCDGALGSGVVTTTHATGAGCDSTFTRKWVATDACGNKDSVSQVITVKYDITKPTTATAHADFRADCNTPFAQLVWANVQWNDNCDGALGSGVVTTTHATGAGCDSTFTRKWVATDACGNKDSVSQVITVKYDITKPTTQTAHADLRADCNTPFAQLVWANVQWTDNCDGALGSGVVTTTHATGAGCDSTFTRKWVATDACGNKDSVSQVITVKYDITKPTTQTAHADLRADCNTPFAQLVWANVQWTDNCDGALGSGVVTTTHATGAGCDSTFTRKWVATDACGNKDSVSQVITVKYDITKPTTATAHADLRADCNTPFGQLVWANVQWSDNCDGALGSGVVTTTHATGAGCDSTFTRKWVATDACGNKDSVSQVITVKYDITKPTTASAHADQRADCNTPFAQLVWANVQWTDNCDGELGSGVVTTTHATGAGCDSTFTRKWVATDGCGNKDSVTQVITVKYDLTKPTTATPHADFRADCNTPFGQLAWANVQWNDNCDGALGSGVVTTTSAPGAGCDSTFTRKWVATDGCGNKDSVTQVITVKYDNTKPTTATAHADFRADCNTPFAQLVWANVQWSDNCDGELGSGVVTTTRATGAGCDSVFTRKWVATDGCGNKDSVTQVITVKYDVTKPTTSTSHADYRADCNTVFDELSWANVTWMDNCDGALGSGVVTTARAAGAGCDSVFTRKWVATDACGNKDSVTQTITVTYDLLPPTVTNNPPATINATCGTTFNTLPWQAPTWTDNCSNVTLVSVVTTPDHQSEICPATYTRVWTVKDGCNNMATFTQTITVPCCQACTYTQGAYGNPGGQACLPNGSSVNQTQIMITALDNQPGDSTVFGRKGTNRYWVLRLTDVNQGSNSNIFKMLPGGGPSKKLGLNTYNMAPEYSHGNTWPVVPLQPNGPSTGKIRNVLLAQTITLWFNTQITGNHLSTMAMGDTIVTVDVPCGSQVPIPGTNDTVGFPHNVVLFLANPGNGYANNVTGLLNLANDMLGGATPSGITLDDVNNTVDGMNNAFDECRMLVGYIPYGNVFRKMPVANTETILPELQVGVFPNPAQENFHLVITSPVTGQANVEILNIDGVRLKWERPYLYAGVAQRVDFKLNNIGKARLSYRVYIQGFQKTGIILIPN